MGFRKGSYATVWDVSDSTEKTSKVRISISRKKKDSEEYEQEFSGFCMFIGDAKRKAEKLKVKDRIKLGDVDVTTWYKPDTKVVYTTFKVFDFEFLADSAITDPPAQSAPKKVKKSALEDMVDDEEVEEDTDDDLPF